MAFVWMVQHQWSLEFDCPVHKCFVKLEKAFNQASRVILLRAGIWEYGVPKSLFNLILSP